MKQVLWSAALALWASPLQAQQAPIDPYLLPLSTAQMEAPAAIAALEAAITQAEAADQPDIRLLFDLAEARAERLRASGRSLEAARSYTDLALFAQARRHALEEDPLALLGRAAALFEAEGRYDSALEVHALILEEVRSGGASGAQTLDEMARLAGLMNDTGLAAQHRAEAEAERAKPPLEGTRGLGRSAGYRTIEVFYATDRAQHRIQRPSTFYGPERGPLETGVAQVTIPESHRPGEIEVPSIWRLEFGPSAAKHVVLREVRPLPRGIFHQRLQAKVAGAHAPEIFVFVHGYNVSFAHAARRAAQLAYDMNFKGVPMLYSWPSRAKTSGYIADTAVVRLSGRRLKALLEEVVASSGASTIHIIAHSMGNRAVTDALELMALERAAAGQTGPVLDQVIFAAPDVDAGLFLEMLPTIRPLAERLTLYASDEDWALAVSRRLHGNAPRAGQAGAQMITPEGLDAIDMSSLGEDMLAHSYFAQDASALVDLSTLFWRNVGPGRRCGIEGTGPAWRYAGGLCKDARVLGVLGALREAGAVDRVKARGVIAGKVEDELLAEEILTTLTPILGE